MDLVKEVKRKKEFSGLPESVVLRAIEGVRSREKGVSDEFLVKEARNFLRKYFGVFLTNRVLRFGRSNIEHRTSKEILESHFSSRKRNYEEFYGRIFESMKKSRRFPQISADLIRVLDLGCGVNGFSYEELVAAMGSTLSNTGVPSENPRRVGKVVGDLRYVGVEAAGQLVDFMNLYFEENGFDGKAVRGDLMDLDFVKKILKDGFDVCFLFQVVDALESIEKDYSKELISLVMSKVSFLVISLPVVSLGGRKRIGEEKRKWLVDWLELKYNILDDFVMFGERVIVVGK